MSSDGNKALVRRLAKAINSGNLEAVDEILAPDYVRHDPTALLREAGVEEYKKAFRTVRKAFPDAEWTIEELLEDGDRVVGRWTFRGTHTGAFGNVPPSGRDVSYPIIGIYRIEDGRIAEDWHIYHALGLWEALIPEIGNLIEKATAT